MEQWSKDYARVERAISHLHAHRLAHPSLEELAEFMELSPAHAQRLFQRWVGVSPKRFIQGLTLEHARALLGESSSVLDTSLEVGLSGPSRLHDLFVNIEAMTPGEYARGGRGVEVRWGRSPSLFGECVIGQAIGRNPIAFLIPCHRVLRKDASLSGYRWGQARKHALLASEFASFG